MVLTAGLGFLFFFVQGQIKKFYTLDRVQEYDTVNFRLKATSGISYVRHVDGGNPLSIFGNPDLDKINPSFDAKVKGRSCFVDLILDEFKESGLGDGLAYAVLKSNDEREDNYWKFLLNDSKVYNLNLHYGIGTSDIDLSGTAVNRLTINTGSADVIVSYQRDEPNLVDMDTFKVKVDVGTLIGRDLAKSRTRNLHAEIGFGQALLDFSDPLENVCSVDASVGAGKLEVVLPNDRPVIIQIKESPLCTVEMVEEYEEVENNVFISKSYDVGADNLLTLNINVSLGSLVFSNAQED